MIMIDWRDLTKPQRKMMFGIYVGSLSGVGFGSPLRVAKNLKQKGLITLSGMKSAGGLPMYTVGKTAKGQIVVDNRSDDRRWTPPKNRWGR